MTNVGTMCGTPYYSAPETFEGDVGKPLDIWSFGIVLLELFGGKHAWGALKHNNELMGNMLKKVQPPALTSLAPKWRDLCLQCIQYEPFNRKPIQEVLKAIRQMC